MVQFHTIKLSKFFKESMTIFEYKKGQHKLFSKLI